MKKISISILLLLLFNLCYGQSYRTETIDWLNPKIYKARTLVFKTDSVKYEAKNCKVFEFRTISGVTGYYIEGESFIEIETKEMSEKCTAAMLRFNPLDSDSLITFENLKEIQDDEFFNTSLKVLKSTFRHCYHSGMDAIIPDKGYYAVNYFSPRIGEVLVSKDKNEMIYYNFTLRTKL